MVKPRHPTPKRQPVAKPGTPLYPWAETSRELNDCRTNLLNIFTDAEMVVNPSKPMGWTINTCRLEAVCL